MDNEGIIAEIKKLLDQDQRESAALRGAAQALPQQREQVKQVDLSRIEQSLTRMEALGQQMLAALNRPRRQS